MPAPVHAILIPVPVPVLAPAHSHAARAPRSRALASADTPRVHLCTAVFLNKFDLLEKKLAAGVKVNRYLPSYADRENSAPVLARCECAAPTCSPTPRFRRVPAWFLPLRAVSTG